MENLILIIATSFVLRLSKPKKFRNKFIGNTGCSILLPEGVVPDRQETASGDLLYSAEFNEGKVTFGFISIRMKEKVSLGRATEILGTYMDKLRGPFFIFHHIGVERDVDWNTTESNTLADHWQDAVKQDWKVKGFTNGRFLAVLFVKNIGEADVIRQEQFLDSYQFPCV